MEGRMESGAGARQVRVSSLGKKQGCNWGNNEEKVQNKKNLGNADRLNIGD